MVTLFSFFVVLLFGPQIERSLLEKEQLLVSKIMCHSAKTASCFYVAEPDFAESRKARCSLELALGLSNTLAKKRWSTGLNDDLNWRPTKQVKMMSAIMEDSSDCDGGVGKKGKDDIETMDKLEVEEGEL